MGSVSLAELVADTKSHLSHPRPDTEAFLQAAAGVLRTFTDAASEVAEGLIAVGHYYALAQTPEVGLPVATDALAYARRAEDHVLEMKALRLLAWLQGDAGNPLAAVTTISEALEMARSSQDVTAECSCWNFLGVFFYQAGQSSASISYFKRAIELAGGDADRRGYKDVANTNIARAALDVGDLDLALKAAESAVTDQLEPSDAVQADTRAMREVIFARVLIECGSIERARHHLASAQAYSEWAGTERSRLNAAITLATWEIAAGQVQAGLARTKETLAEARTRSKGYLPAILSTGVRNYESAGRPDVALSLLREAFAIQKKRQGDQLIKQLERMTHGLPSHSREQGSSDALSHKEQVLTRKIEYVHRVLADSAVRAALACGLDPRRPFRVAKLVEMFGAHQGLQTERLQSVKQAALLADIGMLAVASPILSKSGRLSRAERALLNEHARHSAELVEQVGLEEHQAAVELIRLHHERWDGTGPNGLAGDEIPLEVRILSLCDTFEAMTHDRPWRTAFSVAAALQDIESSCQDTLDPLLAGSFVNWLRSEYWKHRDFDAMLGEEASSSEVVRAKEQIARYMQRGG